MPPPSSTDEFLALVAKSDLLPARRLEEYVEAKRSTRGLPETAYKAAQFFVLDGMLTKYQAEQLLSGRWRNFIIGGKYKLLERLGKGGMALVFLCEHLVMQRLVALKILPTAHAHDKELLGRFHREARALSSLRHPNIVGAYDADRADKIHFLVMEFVDGGDLDQIVQKLGPLPWQRAAHYIRQAAYGLQHAHECGLVHRDIKPGNVLVDRSGTVKLLDLGLARIFHETTDNLTTGRDVQTLLGTVDYLAPEQAVNSHDVDIRADIYGLGATFYYILTGKGLFEDGTVAQKLSWHMHRPPRSIAEICPEVPEGLIHVIDQMLAKRPEDRYQTPGEVVEALEPWTLTEIDPPDVDDFPQLSRAARRLGQASSSRIAQPPRRSSLSQSIRPATPSKVTQVMDDPRPEPVAKAESGPGSVSTQRDIPTLQGAEPAATSPRQRRTRQALAASGFGLAALAVVGGWSLFGPASDSFVASRPQMNPPGSRPLATGSTPAPRPSTPAAPPADQPADAVITLVPTQGPSRLFAGLREAIKAAKRGDRVVVTGSLLVDSIQLSDVEGAPRDLTIEGVAPRSKSQGVRWRLPREFGADRPLLEVSGLEGFHLKGFLFDGQNRVAELIRLSGRSGGSSLEELQVEGATHAGVVLRAWAGESARPSTIRQVSFSTVSPSGAAILIEPDPDRPNLASGSIRVLSSRFVGPFEAAILVGGAVDGLDVEQCRFYRATDGLRYRRTEARGPIRARLVNNTFSELQRGLHFETTPRSGSSELVVANNLFANTGRAATLDRVSVEPARIAARWIWTEEAKKTPTVPPGARQFRKVFDLAGVPTQANLDISCDETFTVWLNGEELMRNPSPHYTQRVFALDVAKHLRVGRNVLAVRGTNRLDRLDSKFGTSAGLLAQITADEAGREVVLAKTDDTWKCSDQAPEGWTTAKFDDQSWASTRPWQDDNVVWPWKFAVWDSTIRSQLTPPLEPIQVLSSGNLRDYRSWEGYPTLDSERVVVQEADLPKEPADDASFLRYPPGHPLAKAGPGSAAVGAFEGR